MSSIGVGDLVMYRNRRFPASVGLVIREVKIKGNARTVGHSYTPLFVVLWTDGKSSDEFENELELAYVKEG